MKAPAAAVAADPAAREQWDRTQKLKRDPRIKDMGHLLPGHGPLLRAAPGAPTRARKALARLWAAGGDFDWAQIWGDAARRRLPLPGYQFQRKRYFIERSTTAVAEAEAELARIEDPAAWGWRPAWKLASPAIEIGPKGPIASQRRNWLVFADDLGIGDRLAELLRALDQGVAVVSIADTFADKGEGRFTLPVESDREGYEMLLAALAAQDRVPDRILHLWSLTRGASFRAGSSLLNSQLERGYFSLLHLAQALGTELPDARLAGVVRGDLAQRVGGVAEQPQLLLVERGLADRLRPGGRHDRRH